MPMYIDAEKVEKWSWQEPRYSDSINDRTDLRDFLKSLPTVSHDEVRGVGEWISNHDGSWNCSECGLRVLIYAKGNYCPNCGAKMKGAEDKS